MPKIERGGVRLVVENYEAFNRQLSAASVNMQGFGQAAQQTAAQVNASASEYRGSTVVIEQWSETVDSSADATLAAETGLIALGAAISVVSAKMLDFVGGTVITASRIRELGILLDVTRQNAANMAQAEADLAAEGYILTEQGEQYVGTTLAMAQGQAAMQKAMDLSNESVQEQVQGIRDLHLSGQIANETVAALIRYQLDWTKATELARLAQDAATFAAQDSSQALEGLIHGITTLQPRVLRSYGIMVNLNEAYRDYGRQNNLVATELTQAQRQQAAFNAVLAQAPAIAGAYEASLGSATKQIRSLQTDFVNLAEAYGMTFEPMVRDSVSALRQFLQAVTALPEPTRNLVARLTAGGTALLTLSSTAATAILVLNKLRTAMTLLQGTALLTSAGILGIIGAAVAVVAYIRDIGEAHEEEAASIAANVDSYPEYVRKLKEAGLEAFAFSEELYDLIKAKQKTDEEFDTEDIEEFQKAADAIEATLNELSTYGSALADPQAQMEEFISLFKNLLPTLDDAQLKVIAAGGAVRDWAKDKDWPIKQANDFDRAMQKLATTTLLYRQEAENELVLMHNRIEAYQAMDTETERLTKAAVRALAALEKLRTSKIDSYMEDVGSSTRAAARGMDTLSDSIIGAIRAIPILSGSTREFFSELTEEFDDANQKMVDAQTKRDRALEDLDTEYQNKAIDAWIDYQRAIEDSEGDLAAYHAGTLQELLDLDREYLRDRNDAWAQYQQDLADAERELQRDIEDANRKRSQALQDMEREYQQDLKDARRELQQNLEDDAREHAQNLEDIERDRIQSQLDLEEEYQRRLYDIQNAGQQRLYELQLEYEEKASDTRLKYLRQALEAIEGQFYAPEFAQTLRELFLNLREFGPGEIPNEFRDAYARMLEELEGLRDDQYWEEQDLSDDIVREYDQRMLALEEWLAEEQAAIDAAAEEKRQKEEQRYAEEQESRQRDYERKLEDLRISREREREEIERDHQQRLADLRLQHERERQEIALDYQRRLEDLAIEYERQRQLVGEKLEEQNADARKKYAEALEDLARAKQREHDEIMLQFSRTRDDSLAELDQTVTELGDKYGLLPAELRPTHDALKSDLHNLLVADPDSLTNQWTNFLNNLHRRILEGGSPSRVMMRIGESVISGLEKGMGGQTIGDLLTGSFDAAALQANIQAALPPNRVSVPMGMMGNTRNTTYTDNLTVNAQYQHQSEASLRNDLALYHNMMRAWRR